jgi:hypothetical protein
LIATERRRVSFDCLASGLSGGILSAADDQSRGQPAGKQMFSHRIASFEFLVFRRDDGASARIKAAY